MKYTPRRRVLKGEAQNAQEMIWFLAKVFVPA
jgi:hypothetical protein